MQNNFVNKLNVKYGMFSKKTLWISVDSVQIKQKYTAMRKHFTGFIIGYFAPNFFFCPTVQLYDTDSIFPKYDWIFDTLPHKKKKRNTIKGGLNCDYFSVVSVPWYFISWFQ